MVGIETITVADKRSDSYYRPGRDFLVVKLINTTRFVIGAVLSQQTVNDLIRDSWTVKIIPLHGWVNIEEKRH
ncbi:hypothetical protein KAR91_60315 [Candidatus Pacearchaeota archaeon]|nr:hypothetical protein [Candidatus Pacearchaeota archaeon]